MGSNKPCIFTPSQLSLKQAFLFPVNSKQGREDVLTGGLFLLLFLPVGWILNMGHRLNTVRNFYAGQHPASAGFYPIDKTFNRGLVALKTILLYLSPAMFSAIAALLSFWFQAGWVISVSFLFCSFMFFVLGVFVLPGCMTVYAVEEDPTVLNQPIKAFKRAWAKRKCYTKAWWIALLAITLSFLGLMPYVLGWVFTSVWAWEVVGYVFTIALYSMDD
jgi:hypothetical protein